MRSKNECINASNKLYKWNCNKNVTAYASSSASYYDNYPCNPLLEKPKKFFWLPNDQKLWINFRMSYPFA